ncbi:MAG TPA: class C sortase [Ruminococcaceae bacterium]|nr:class C sortase [Oscillospiraceae bacterium]
MKKTVLIIIIVLLGIGIFAYPYVADYLSEVNSSRAVQEYAEAVETLDDATLDEEMAKARKYNDELAGDPVHDPFVPGSGMVRSQEYANILNVGGSMGQIEIPKIEVKLPIYHGTTEETLQKGIGHLEGTSLPVGGPRTHAVLTGHRGLSNAHMFTDLIELQEGDMFYLHILKETLAYKVDKISVKEPEDTAELGLFTGQDYVTLITCTPYGINSHRLIVRGTRVIPYIPGMEEEDAALANSGWTEEERLLFFAGIITASIMLLLIILALIWRRRRDKREKQRAAEKAERENAEILKRLDEELHAKDTVSAEIEILEQEKSAENAALDEAEIPDEETLAEDAAPAKTEIPDEENPAGEEQQEERHS